MKRDAGADLGRWSEYRTDVTHGLVPELPGRQFVCFVRTEVVRAPGSGQAPNPMHPSLSLRRCSNLELGFGRSLARCCRSFQSDFIMPHRWHFFVNWM